MRARNATIALLAAGTMAACGGGSGGNELSEAAAQPGPPAASIVSDDATAQTWALTKYAGRWQQCIQMGATASAGSKLDRFELEPLSANVLKYRQSRTYHANTTGCSLPEGESLDDQPITRGHGTFELLGQSKIVNSVDSEKALWTPELPSDFTDAAMTEKTTLGIKDGVMYIGSTSGALDADGFPEQYYHALRRLP